MFLKSFSHVIACSSYLAELLSSLLHLLLILPLKGNSDFHRRSL